MRKRLFLPLLALGAAFPGQAADKPNILVIMADDVGLTNLSVYSPRAARPHKSSDHPQEMCAEYQRILHDGAG